MRTVLHCDVSSVLSQCELYAAALGGATGAERTGSKEPRTNCVLNRLSASSLRLCCDDIGGNIMVSYYQLGSQKQLNEIVMVGSHDAAITQGMSHVQTQSLNIADQADAGVRIFDLRITGGVVGKVGVDKKPIGQLAAYHGSGIGAKGRMGVVETRTGQHAQMQVKPMTGVMGAYGQTLSAILTQARAFVENGNEFLILKFDKCSNWQMIAEACVDLLGGTIYTAGGNLNTATLQQLAGHVVVLFGADGLKIIPSTYGAKGILGFKNLYSKSGTPGVYDPNFNGLQYVGKGGTKVGGTGLLRTYKYKMKENVKKQTKSLAQGARVNQDVMGMMYWTTTGTTTSIKDRNKFLWNEENQEGIVDLWESRIPQNVDPTLASAAGMLKMFMPNFIMIDFADGPKCDKIFDLNFLSAMHLHNAAVDQING